MHCEGEVGLGACAGCGARQERGGRRGYETRGMLQLARGLWCWQWRTRLARRLRHQCRRRARLEQQLKSGVWWGWLVRCHCCRRTGIVVGRAVWTKHHAGLRERRRRCLGGAFKSASTVRLQLLTSARRSRGAGVRWHEHAYPLVHPACAGALKLHTTRLHALVSAHLDDAERHRAKKCHGCSDADWHPNCSTHSTCMYISLCTWRSRTCLLGS
jgi:hypothetical protein